MLMIMMMLVGFVRVATSVPASTSSLVPALGDTWAHAITTRLLLHWDHSGLYAMSNNSHQRRQRVATLVKSPAMPLQSVAFVVNKKGIRDVPSTAAVSTANHAPAIAEQQQQQQQEERLHAQVAHQMQQVRCRVCACVCVSAVTEESGGVIVALTVYTYICVYRSLVRNEAILECKRPCQVLGDTFNVSTGEGRRM